MCSSNRARRIFLPYEYKDSKNYRIFLSTPGDASNPPSARTSSLRLLRFANLGHSVWHISDPTVINNETGFPDDNEIRVVDMLKGKELKS